MMIMGIYLQLRWLSTNSIKPLVLGTLCFAFNLLVRIPCARAMPSSYRFLHLLFWHAALSY